jgi:hypothetical protein
MKSASASFEVFCRGYAQSIAFVTEDRFAEGRRRVRRASAIFSHHTQTFRAVLWRPQGDQDQAGLRRWPHHSLKDRRRTLPEYRLEHAQGAHMFVTDLALAIRGQELHRAQVFRDGR